MRIRGLVAAVVILQLALTTSTEAAITFFTDRVAWEAAAGAPMFAENFSSFPVDTPFHSSAVALNGMAIQQEGTERMAFNEVDVPPLQFSPNSGNSSGLLLTNFPEGGSSGIQVHITFTDLNMAFGFDSWSGNDGEGAVLEVFSGETLLGLQALTGGSRDFLGYVLTGEDTSTEVQFRSNRLTPGMVGERFCIDNLTGINAIALAGDYNQNGTVDAADYVVWRKGLGTTYTQTDYDVWRAHFGATAEVGAASRAAQSPPRLGGPTADVPEPASIALLLIGLAAITANSGLRQRPRLPNL
jgi:hypothetical protein